MKAQLVGAVIRDWRRAANLSGKDLATRANISPNGYVWISKLERGQFKNFNQERVGAALAVLGKTWADLERALAEVGNPPIEPPPTEHSANNGDDIELIEAASDALRILSRCRQEAQKRGGTVKSAVEALLKAAGSAGVFTWAYFFLAESVAHATVGTELLNQRLIICSKTKQSGKNVPKTFWNKNIDRKLPCNHKRDDNSVLTLTRGQ